MKKTRILFSVLILFAVCFFIKNNVKAESITGKCVCTHNYYLSNGILKSSAQENKTDATTEAGCEYYKGVADLNWQKCSWQWLDTCAPATGRCVCKYYNYHSNGLVSSIDSGKIKTDSNYQAGCEYYKGAGGDLNWQYCTWQVLTEEEKPKEYCCCVKEEESKYDTKWDCSASGTGCNSKYACKDVVNSTPVANSKGGNCSTYSPVTATGKAPDTTPTTTAISISRLKQDAANLNPAKLTSPAQMIGRGIYFSLSIIGMVTFVLYIWAGVLWMTSAGNAERKSQAMKIFIWTSMGALVIALSYVLVSFIFSQAILK